MYPMIQDLEWLRESLTLFCFANTVVGASSADECGTAKLLITASPNDDRIVCMYICVYSRTLHYNSRTYNVLRIYRIGNERVNPILLRVCTHRHTNLKVFNHHSLFFEALGDN